MDKLVDFIIDRMPYYKPFRKEVERLIEVHMGYGTFDYEEDYNGVVYCVRYNILKSGKIADILDLCVREKEPFGVIKYVIVKNMQKWPKVEAIRFIRGKHKDRESVYKLSDILKKEMKWAVLR